MNMDAVIGCAAIDAQNDWLRLHTADGALRTIPWTAVKMAGMGGNHAGHMQIQGVTEKVTPYFATHDSLWIVSGDGALAQAMLEKADPKRAQIFATFEQQLGDRWRGDELKMSELTDEMFKMPLPGKFPKMMIVMIAVAAGMILLAVVLSIVGSHRSQ